MIRALISSIVLWGIIVDRELYQKNKQIVFSSILIRAKWIRQRRVCHFWRHSSRDQEDTRNFNYNLELLEESPSKHIYIYIYTSYKHPLWYIWIKSNRGMKGAFPAQGIVTQKNARLRSRIPSMPLANYSPLHSSKSSTFLDTWSSTNRDSSRWFTKPRFLYRSWKKKKKIDREIGVVRYSQFSHLAEIRKKSIPSNLTLKIPAKQSDSNIIYSTTRETFVETKVPSERQDRSRQAPG